MKFFHLEPPRDLSDYQFTWINGSARTKFAFPGVKCSICGLTGGMPGGLLPISLPEQLRQEPRLRDRWPISEAAHQALRAEVEAALSAEHADLPPIPSGAKFLPIKWTVPSRPEGEMFWPSMDGPVVSAAFAQALESLGATGFALLPVEEIRCGTEPPDREAPIPESGEPEDLDAWATAVPGKGKAFHLLSVTAEGDPGTGMHTGPACDGCGRAETDRGGNWRTWDDSFWPGTDFFRFPTTRWIIVTERVADLLAKRRIGNLNLTPLVSGRPVVEEQFPGMDDRMREARETGKRRAKLVGRIDKGEDLGDDEDLRRMAGDLATRHQTVTVLAAGTEQARQPNLELREGNELAGYVIVLSLQAADASRRPGVIDRVAARVSGAAAAATRFERMSELVHDAIGRFDAVNPDLAAANILIFVDHDSGLTSNDLHSVLTAEDGASYHQSKRDFDAKTKGEKTKLDLCLWADAAGKRTEHFLLPMRGRMAYLSQFMHLGEQKPRKPKR